LSDTHLSRSEFFNRDHFRDLKNKIDPADRDQKNNQTMLKNFSARPAGKNGCPFDDEKKECTQASSYC
jgi:hypothetical protein